MGSHSGISEGDVCDTADVDPVQIDAAATLQHSPEIIEAGIVGSKALGLAGGSGSGAELVTCKIRSARTVEIQLDDRGARTVVEVEARVALLGLGRAGADGCEQRQGEK